MKCGPARCVVRAPARRCTSGADARTQPIRRPPQYALLSPPIETTRECRSKTATGGDIVAVLPPEDLEFGLRIDESEHVAVSEVLPGGQAAAEVDQRRALHQGVVDVEERRCGQVDGRQFGFQRFVGVDVFQRPLGAGVGGLRLELLLSGLWGWIVAGFDTARAAGSGHGFTLSGRGGLGWGWQS